MSISDEPNESELSVQTPSGRFRDEVKQHFWRNYLAHTIEGGLFMGGMTFLAADSVMPRMIQTLGGPDWIIAFIPTFMFLGFTGPPLFTAHLIERLERMKPVIMLSSVFQRVPFLVAGIALLYFSGDHPLLVLVIVIIAPFVCGFSGGCTMPAWMELVARTVPENRRASLWAIRYIITAIIGFGAGSIIKAELTDHPGAEGYAILHFYTFGFLVMSYLVLIMIRETDFPRNDNRKDRGLIENIGSLPQLLREDSRLRWVLISRVFGSGLYVMVPFLSIYVLEVTGMEDGFLGELVKAQMAGMIIGNIIGGVLGDKLGGKLPAMVALILLACVSALAVLCSTTWQFSLLFFFLGFGIYLYRVGATTLQIEICPVERRGTYMAVSMTTSFFGMVMSALLCWMTRELTPGLFWPATVISAIALLASCIAMFNVAEPRALSGR